MRSQSRLDLFRFMTRKRPDRDQLSGTRLKKGKRGEGPLTCRLQSQLGARLARALTCRRRGERRPESSRSSHAMWSLRRLPIINGRARCVHGKRSFLYFKIFGLIKSMAPKKDLEIQETIFTVCCTFAFVLSRWQRDCVHIPPF